MGDLLFDDLVARLARAPRDERRVIERVLARLEVGRQRYGALDLAKPRDWRRERFEERIDALVYDVAEELALEDSAIARAAEAEWRGDEQATRIGGPGPYLSVEVDDLLARGGKTG